MSSLAERARTAADAHPFVRDGLRAGIVNFSQAARFLDVDGEEEAVATALRRYAERLPPIEVPDGSVRVSMEREVGRGGGDLLAVDGVEFGSGDGGSTAIQAVGAVDARFVATVLSRLDATIETVEAVAHADDVLVVIVPSRDATTVLTTVEDVAERDA
ncbi:MAG: hypothetical protein ABEJ55_06560 [Halanaeroarchaeum sp.]